MPFSAKKADDAVSFFRNYLRHTKGRFAGAPFVLQPWQARDIIRPIFGTVRKDGTRQYRQVLVEIPRKCGKSEIAAGVALKCLIADQEMSAEVYGAAADREQASVVYNVAEQMVHSNPLLRARCKVTSSRKNIAYLRTMSKYRVVSADGGRQHGLNPSCVIFDEVHVQRHRRLWDALTMGSDTRMQPLIFAITTAGVPDEAPLWWDLHEYARQVREGLFKDPSFLSVHYGATEKDDFDDPKVWKRCNPALGSFLSLEAFREAWARAKRIPSEWNEFLRYRLNYPTQQADRWLSVPQWDAAADEALDFEAMRGYPCFIGVDLSTRKDITAVVACIQLPDRRVALRPYFFLPAAAVPRRLEPWVTAGHIRVTPGNTVDFAAVRAQILQLGETYNVQRVLFDPFQAGQLSHELGDEGFRVQEDRYGFTKVSGPAKEFEAAIAEKRIVHDGNPVLRWMVDCVSIRSDQTGNILPVKPDRLKTEKRIDGVVAAIYGSYPALLLDESESEPMGFQINLF